MIEGRNTEANGARDQHSPVARRETVGVSRCSLAPFRRLITRLIYSGSESRVQQRVDICNRVLVNVQALSKS